MRRHLIAFAISGVLFALLATVLGGLFYSAQSSIDSSSIIPTIVLLAPPIVAGYLGGRYSGSWGIALAAVAVTLSAALLYGLIFSGSYHGSQQLTNIVLAALAGGCGELHAKAA